MNRPPSGHPRTAVLGGQHAVDRRDEGLADLVDKPFELTVVGGLRDSLASRMDCSQAFE